MLVCVGWEAWEAGGLTELYTETSMVHGEPFEEVPLPDAVFLRWFWKPYHWPFILFDQVLSSQGSSWE